MPLFPTSENYISVDLFFLVVYTRTKCYEGYLCESERKDLYFEEN